MFPSINAGWLSNILLSFYFACFIFNKQEERFMKSDIQTDINKKIRRSITAIKRDEITKESLFIIASTALALEITSNLNDKFNKKLERHARN
jgi:hypothetical protein